MLPSVAYRRRPESINRLLYGILSQTFSSIGGFARLSHVVPEDELADLLADDSTSTKVMSPWKQNVYSRDSILFPNNLLEITRSSDLNVRSTERLSQLWSMSASHGVSWDELDDAFLCFHREYLRMEAEWTDNYDLLWDREYKKCESRLRTTLQGDDAQVTSLLNRRRGKVRRMTYTRLSRLRSKQVIKPFSLPAFTDYMKEFVSHRVAKREESEKRI